MQAKMWIEAFALGAVVAVGSIGPAQANATQTQTQTQPSQRALTSAVTQYLSDHGDLCVGKFNWPRVVTQEDRAAGTSDAVQLPVLERLGLVESVEIPVPAAADSADAAAQGPRPAAGVALAQPAKSYSLTAKGRRYYFHNERITLGAHDQPVKHAEDLCVARLRLDKVVKWTPPEPVHSHLETLVHYTYHIKSAEWMADPDARRVFPVVDRIIRGQGNMLMSVSVQLKDGKWTPVLPGQ